MCDSKQDEDEDENEGEEEEDSDDVEEEKVSPPASPNQDRKGKRKMINQQSAPLHKRITRSIAATFVEADSKPASPTKPAPPQTENKEDSDSPQVNLKPAVDKSILGSSSAAPPSSLDSSSAADEMSFFKAEFLKLSRKLNLFELKDAELQKQINEKINKTDSILSDDHKEMNKKFNDCLKELHEEMIDISETVAHQTFDKQAPSIITHHDLVNTSLLAALELENEMYVDAMVEALQTENAKLWKFIKSHIGKVKEDEHGQFVIDKGQSS